MDTELDQVMAGILASEGVTGAMFIDRNGLCLAAAGDANALSAGLLSMISSVEHDKLPLTLPGEKNRDILLTHKDGTTVAIFKKNA